MKNIFKAKSTKKNPYFNHEGYADPTACHAIKNATKEEEHIEKQVGEIIHIVKVLCDLTGFEIVGRIKIKHKKSGKEFG